MLVVSLSSVAIYALTPIESYQNDSMNSHGPSLTFPTQDSPP